MTPRGPCAAAGPATPKAASRVQRRRCRLVSMEALRQPENRIKGFLRAPGGASRAKSRANPHRIKARRPRHTNRTTGYSVYANDNPYRYTDPDGRACRAATKTSPGGCWNTPAERKLANEGNWKAYYKLAGGKGHDPYAQRAGNVASNSGKGYEGLLDAVTNIVLKISIAENLPVMPAAAAKEAVATSMEHIRVDLVKARVNLLDQKGATEQKPATMTRQEAADFHQSTFLKNGAGNVFGGKIYDSILSSPGKALYNWCPEPSCK